MNMFTPQRI